MAKKLKVEVEADTQKAKRKLEELAQGGDGAGGSAAEGAANRTARAMDNAARSAGRLSQAAQEGSANLRATAKVFGGMAVRMAASYAAQSMPEGSKERVAMDVGGSAVAGALQGSVAGPIGALAGGVMGLTQALMNATAAERERAAAVKSAIADFEKAEESYADSRKWSEKMKSINTVEDASAELAKLKEAEAYSVRSIKFHIRNSKNHPEMMEEANAERTALGVNRSRQQSLESLIERLTGSADKPAFRVSPSALDSLARIGGSMGGVDSMREVARNGEEQLKVLKSIDQKTSKEDGTWQ